MKVSFFINRFKNNFCLSKNIIMPTIIFGSLFLTFFPSTCINAKKGNFSINILQNSNVQNLKPSPNGNISPDSSSTYMSSTHGFIKENNFFDKHYKATLFIGSIAGSYALSLYTIYFCKNYIENKNLWSNWLNNTNIEKLMDIPQDVMAQKIFDEINLKYNNLESIETWGSPTIRFVKEIEKEKDNIEILDNVYKFLKKYYILKIFPINTKPFDALKEKLEKIVYIKNIFLSSQYVTYNDSKKKIV